MKEFKMKDLEKTKYCLCLQIEHLVEDIFVQQSTFVGKMLKRFYMDKAQPLNILMQVRLLDMKKDVFWPWDDDEELFGLEVPYVTAICAIISFANNTRSDIAFSANLLARYSSSPLKGHWDGIKYILSYFQGTKLVFYFSSHDWHVYM